jgi:hypothetical protein
MKAPRRLVAITWSNITGAYAYMYFGSAGTAKTGSYVNYLGTGLSTPSGTPP